MRLFTDTLRDMRAGQTLEDLTQALHHMVQQCIATGKPGELTLSITVKPIKNSAEAVQVLDKINAKEPRFDQDGSLFFVTATGELSRTNPRQEVLDLRTVDTSRPEPVNVPRTAGGAQ